MTLYIVIAVFIVVSIAFVVVFKRQNKALKNVRKVSGRGGDEINIIKENTDYGWPFVTFGKAYTNKDYVKPGKAGTHDGFEKPVKYWVPSIAPTELVQLPNNWGNYSKQIVMGTLREESLVFMTITPAGVVTGEKRIKVGERIRDLDIDENKHIVATTDSGKIMVFKFKK